MMFTALSATGNDAEDLRPNYRMMMQRNTFLPGSAQKALGQNDQALGYYMSLPLMVVGNAMALSGVIWGGGWISFDVQQQDGDTVLLKYNEQPGPWSQVLMYGGSVVTLYGNVLAAYSTYAAHRDYVDLYGDPFGRKPLTLIFMEIIRVTILDAYAFVSKNFFRQQPLRFPLDCGNLVMANCSFMKLMKY